MSLHCPTSPIYHTSPDHKRRARDAARKRCGTPKILRDLLREKCRIRLHEARQCTFQRGRKLVDQFSKNESHQIDEILRQEVAELEKDAELQDEIYRELRAEADEWFAEQFEQEENYLIEVGEANDLICPICQKATMDFDTQNLYSCGCGTSFLYTGNSQQLRSILDLKVEEHGQHCNEGLLFFVEPYIYASNADTKLIENERFVLSAMCDNCDYFVSL